MSTGIPPRTEVRGFLPEEPVTLTLAQWNAIVAHLRLAEEAYPGKLFEIEQLIAGIERENGVVTYVVWVRWRDANSPQPSADENPAEWPPTLTAAINQTSPVTKATIEAFVAQRTTRPAGIWVTRDPAGQVGWMKLGAYP